MIIAFFRRVFITADEIRALDGSPMVSGCGECGTQVTIANVTTSFTRLNKINLKKNQNKLGLSGTRHESCVEDPRVR
jgi:hypothetical protein